MLADPRCPSKISAHVGPSLHTLPSTFASNVCGGKEVVRERESITLISWPPLTLKSGSGAEEGVAGQDYLCTDLATVKHNLACLVEAAASVSGQQVARLCGGMR
jgi:hypothetical protein